MIQKNRKKLPSNVSGALSNREGPESPWHGRRKAVQCVYADSIVGPKPPGDPRCPRSSRDAPASAPPTSGSANPSPRGRGLATCCPQTPHEVGRSTCPPLQREVLRPREAPPRCRSLKQLLRAAQLPYEPRPSYLVWSQARSNGTSNVIASCPANQLHVWPFP